MPRVKKLVSPSIAAQAELLRARRALGEIDTLRLVQTALSEGVSQADIAETLHVSQATVSRMAAKVAVNARLAEPNVDEIINRAAAHEIDRAEMLRQLRSLRIMYAGDRRRPNSGWAALRAARRGNRISQHEGRAMAEDVARRLVGRVTASMDLGAQPVPEPTITEMVQETTAKMVADLE